MNHPAIASTPPAEKPWKRWTLRVGWLLLIFGGLLTYDLLQEPSRRILPPPPGKLLIVGPAWALLGIVKLVTHYGARWVGKGVNRFLMILGWAMMIVGLFPFWGLGAWTRLHGGRPGNEGDGMAGTLMIIFVGLPGLALTVFNYVRARRRRLEAEESGTVLPH